MNEIFRVIDIIGVIFDIFIGLNLFKCVANEKSTNRLYRYINVCVLIVIQCIVIVYVRQQIIVTIMLYIVLICASLQYELSIAKRLLYSGFVIVIYSLAEFLTGILLSEITGIGFVELCKNVMYYAQGVLISKLIVFVVVKFISYSSVKTQVKIDKRVFIIMAALPASTVFIVFAMADVLYTISPYRINTLLVIAIILLIVSNVFVFYMFEYQLRVTEEKNKQELIKQNLENKAVYYEELSNRQIITNKAMHDMKNKLFALKQLCRDDGRESMEVIDNLCDDIGAAYTLNFTGIEAVDALITSKSLVMKEKNIQFESSIYVAKENYIDLTDWCVLLGNLLDNAIEANENINSTGNGKYVFLKIQQKNNYVSIDITNSKSLDAIKIDMSNIVTGKQNKAIHGFGLRSIKEIVDKYYGNMIVEQKDCIFEVIIIIKNCKRN